MNNETRPLIRPELGRSDRLFQLAAVAGTIALVAMCVVGPNYLPSRVPLHFNAIGEPDRWGSSLQLILLPVIAFALYAGLTVLARVPHHYNYPWPITAENALRQYALARRLILALRAVITWIFVGMLWGIARTALGISPGLGPWFLVVALGAVGVPVALYLFAASRAR